MFNFLRGKRRELPLLEQQMGDNITMAKISINYKCNYKIYGKMSHITGDGETYITSFEGIAAIKDSVNTTKELIDYYKKYWKKRGFEVFILTLDNGTSEKEEFSYNSDRVIIQEENNSFYFIVNVDIMDSSYSNNNNNNKQDNDIFACYKTVTEIDKDGRTIIASYKESQCFKDEVSATAFVECEIKHLIFEDVIRFMDTEKKSSYLFNPQNREWIYTKHSTEVGNRSLTRIEFTVEYIGRLFS